MSIISKKFPDDLIALIRSSKYVHVATCSKYCEPSVSLMNYVYLEKPQLFSEFFCADLKGAYEDSDGIDNGYIIFATFDETEKIGNIRENPKVSLLFHDWISANNLSLRKGNPLLNSSGSIEFSPQYSHGNRISNVLNNLEDNELNQMSATITGHARIVDCDSDESTYYMRLLLGANPDADIFILAENAVIVIVKMLDAKVSDNENNVGIYK
ncbi:uncharacterized protein GVI51_H00099 [Nakaseomyces glabratus]|uniref:Pyridoxamine 5'-phosphate oxidase N-terminal domain-containing protein n=2 Tax=Candida glabrata TaxID=5478 RepID=Q6FSI4_CANGA|nr:uncharacterized protein CAGL0H00286g [Nakaseomyces glabratus]KAH7585995.1 Pyridoxamine 5'-phosphate oxidase [Nakaseomyces glabratus]KAH7588154.1 Pyridoxamine 5'-phosphate oxidase [Nakaseomyces glabratus]KAH7591967.1 Pyridoxamine 5'-phosphate oxidase [Nakaseomyces glabratus]KAH7600612.1 Pyridoxamine 5'-phosphate oxidase [Nakaseomyces glabratus]KAH7601231.1 Pyridoxamine 5'-phosphate oxidase [Nakaseomyces glabratus]|eukprot:XP_446810.1 uncharacterized protein CAGL0H00286g [[Candida] glabrata]